MFEWSIRSLMSPVITRLLIYGVNPIDVEFVVSAVEKKSHLNVRSLEKSWMEEWEKKASRYGALAEEAEEKGNLLSAQMFYFYAAQCYYAIYLINLASMEEKHRIYSQYSALYQKSMQYASWKVERLEIFIDEKTAIPGYLHLPAGRGGDRSGSCVVIYSGPGSCKEEMHTLAEPLVKRGLAVLVPDMPGNGEALFMRDVKCRINNLDAVFQAVLNTLEKRDDFQNTAFGVCGLYMGSGYAYRAACLDSRYVACVNLFPIWTPEVTPRWMKQDVWYDYQTGGVKTEEFIREMKKLEAGAVSCPFLFIHGRNDNQMTLETALGLYNNACGAKEMIIVEEEPVFSNQYADTIPVGEQLHWISHVAADWMNARLQQGNER
jgi:dienelactone hydrolase